MLGDKALRAQFDLATRTASESSVGGESSAASSASSEQGVASMSVDLCNRVFEFVTLRYTRIRHLYTLRDILSEAKGKGKQGADKATRARAKPKAWPLPQD